MKRGQVLRNFTKKNIQEVVRRVSNDEFRLNIVKVMEKNMESWQESRGKVGTEERKVRITFGTGFSDQLQPHSMRNS